MQEITEVTSTVRWAECLSCYQLTEHETLTPRYADGTVALPPNTECRSCGWVSSPTVSAVS